MAICQGWKCSIIAVAPDLRCKISVSQGFKSRGELSTGVVQAACLSALEVDMIYGQRKLNHFGTLLQVGTLSLNVHLWTSAALFSQRSKTGQTDRADVADRA